MAAIKNPGGVWRPRKQNRRKWLTFMRMIRFGINNFSRNAWLTTAATLVMMVTLLIIFGTVVARNVFNDTIQDLQQKVDISFYLRDGLTEQQRTSLRNQLVANPLVTGVDYRSKEQAREEFAKNGASDLAQLEALNVLEGSNPFPASFRVRVSDPSRLNELDSVFAQPAFKEAQNPDRQPTFQGSRRDAIDRIANTARFTERAGLVLSIVAVIISTLIIFNTIRMAIFNRRDEIQMMKLIGADRQFIQGPFIVEAILYGVLAAVVATSISYPLILTQADALSNYGIVISPTLSFLQSYSIVVVAALMVVGAMIGLFSSYLAIRRYMKL